MQSSLNVKYIVTFPFFNTLFLFVSQKKYTHFNFFCFIITHRKQYNTQIFFFVKPFLFCFFCHRFPVFLFSSFFNLVTKLLFSRFVLHAPKTPIENTSSGSFYTDSRYQSHHLVDLHKSIHIAFLTLLMMH